MDLLLTVDVYLLFIEERKDKFLTIKTDALEKIFFCL